MATRSMIRRSGLVAAAILLAACAVPSPGPTAASTPSPAATANEAQASATPSAARPDCAGVFDAAAGRVAMTTGGFETTYGVAIIDADGSNFELIVEPGPPQSGQPHAGTQGPRWTADGGVLFASNRAGGPDDWHVFLIGPGGGDPVQLTGGDDGIEFNPVMSPDSSRLVYAKAVATPEGPDPFRDAGIFVSDPDGGNERQLTAVPEGGTDEWPDISPDGKRIVFARVRVAEAGLYSVNVDGTGLRPLTIEPELQQPFRPRWSPDGSAIVISSNADRFETESANVWVVAPDGAGLRQVTHESIPSQAWAPDWSPDGQHVVFVHMPRSAPAGLDVVALDGTPVCTLWAGTGDDAGWDPDWGPPAKR